MLREISQSHLRWSKLFFGEIKIHNICHLLRVSGGQLYNNVSVLIILNGTKNCIKNLRAIFTSSSESPLFLAFFLIFGVIFVWADIHPCRD